MHLLPYWGKIVDHLGGCPYIGRLAQKVHKILFATFSATQRLLIAALTGYVLMAANS